MHNKNIRFITEIAIFSAISIVLDFICGQLFAFSWLNGGSISIAMLPIYIIAFRWGLKGGLTTGLIVGTIQIIWSSYLIHPVQVMLDYPIAYGVIGLAGIFARNVLKSRGGSTYIYIILGLGLPGLIRLASHTISGLYFEVDLLPSFIYNAGYMIPSIVTCIILMIILIKKNKNFIFIEE